MKLSDEQMLDVLREAGHEEAATALEQKMTAKAAVAAGTGDASAGDGSSGGGTVGGEPTGVDLMARAYAASEKAGGR